MYCNNRGDGWMILLYSTIAFEICVRQVCEVSRIIDIFLFLCHRIYCFWVPVHGLCFSLLALMSIGGFVESLNSF